MASGVAVCVLLVLALSGGSGAAETEEVAVGELDGEVSLRCWNASSQVLVVQWFQGQPGKVPMLFSSDGTLPSDSRFSLVENSSLHISGLRWEDEGHYVCREILAESNHTHRIQLRMASGPDRMEVSISPTGTLPNGTLYARRYDILNFTCSSDSRPDSATKWDFNPLGSAREPFTKVNSSQSYFVLENIAPNYQGNYSCLATNLLSQRQKSVVRELLVYCTYDGKYCFFQNWQEPSPVPTPLCFPPASERPMVMSNPMKSCFVGRSVEMTCELTAGNPLARITWLRNLSKAEVEIRSGGRFLVSQKDKVSTLVIQNCSTSRDQGYYICKAKNPLGLREVYVHLKVTEPVNIAGIVGSVVVLLLLGVLVFSGILLYAGPQVCLKVNVLRNQDEGDILELIDSDEEDLYLESTSEPTSHQTEGIGNGCSTRSTESSFPGTSISLEEIQRSQPTS
ncbi:PREDICTED: V-set and immunoglobulin domain-containing protein 10 [Thamnophis sirtalis]|uniref:V-set and immunoglobulin domain-containing protein 10 n=1 Tax=Thamnophis sirtalis TaxID=35019 RepID=UPI0006B18D9D|nr:PREDICTED: V-set and immunoglobulin domain-containing protein 10 [Thamnophis sirtalis]